MATKQKIDVYGIVTERMIAALEAGTAPWRKPWAAGGMMPRNLKSGKAYRGMNVFILAAQAYASPYWLTYKQAADMGGTVRKGERGTPVVFWNFVDDRKAQASGEKGKKIPFLRYYTVFNVSQCGIPTGLVDATGAPILKPFPAPDVTPTVKGPAEAIDAAEAIIAGYLNPPAIREDASRAFYRPSEDTIAMPPRATFDAPAEFYCTMFHEMGHSTGHHSRLNRTGIASPSYYGSHEYSREELVAEMTAAFLCAEAGILIATADNSASYLAGWIRALKGDSRLLVQAAGEAQKAADHILNRKYEAPEEAAE